MKCRPLRQAPAKLRAGSSAPGRAPGGIAAGVLLAMLVGCGGADLARLSRCPESGVARYAGIPIGSGSEHQQARRFAPLAPGNCMVYVVRERDSWTGASVRRTLVLLTPAAAGPPPLPADPRNLPAVYGQQVREIDDHVYAAWELRPGRYLLRALFRNDYGAVFLSRSAGSAGSRQAAQADLDCLPEAVLFFAAGDRGYWNDIVLVTMDREAGEQAVRDGLRSVGCLDPENAAFRDCDLEW